MKKFFHVMSNVESLDNQTFLSYMVDSFIDVFQLQDFHLFSVFLFHFPKEYGRGVQGGCGLEVSTGSHLGGATCRGLVGLPCSCI